MGPWSLVPQPAQGLHPKVLIAADDEADVEMQDECAELLEEAGTSDVLVIHHHGDGPVLNVGGYPGFVVLVVYWIVPLMAASGLRSVCVVGGNLPDPVHMEILVEDWVCLSRDLTNCARSSCACDLGSHSCAQRPHQQQFRH